MRNRKLTLAEKIKIQMNENRTLGIDINKKLLRIEIFNQYNLPAGICLVFDDEDVNFFIAGGDGYQYLEIDDEELCYD